MCKSKIVNEVVINERVFEKSLVGINRIDNVDYGFSNAIKEIIIAMISRMLCLIQLNILFFIVF